MMPLFIDQLGRRLELKQKPSRIISLVPSQTELLFDLGLDEEVVGITKFCVHPEQWFRTKTRVGGTKQADLQKIRELQPDLIIANKEENEPAQIEELERDFPVWVSDVCNLRDALQMIKQLGMITGKNKSSEIYSDIKFAFDGLKTATREFAAQREAQGNTKEIRTAYLIWQEPYMSVGNDTFIHDMMQRCGLENIFAHRTRYPQATIADLRDMETELVLLSSEPFPFKQKHVEALQSQLPESRVMLADGEMFSWYGSRLRLSPQYFEDLQRQVLSLTHAS